MKKTVKKNYAKLALALHKKLRGKVEVMPKIPVMNKEDLAVVYTPGVGAVSSHLATHPEDVAQYTMKGNMVAVVTDGSAVLGLGNIGPEAALPVMEGKSMLFKSLADVDAFPIVLATQDTEEIVETVKRIAPGFGGINLEDIAAPRCFEIEARLQAELNIPVMHDDQHGTAMVVLTGFINALKVVKKKKEAVWVVISGAGAAGQAIAELLLLYGVQNIVMLDSRGILGPNRSDLDQHKQSLRARTNPDGIDGDLTVAIAGADVFIGVSKGGLLTEDHVRTMAEDAVVFALANPVPEIMPEVALSAGARIVATGRSDFPNQINNSLGFPGIFRGALDHRVQRITDVMLVKAAKYLAALVAKPTAGNIIPNTFDKRVVSAVARAIR
ncbi:MAG: NADP-dependent malic enzyme [Candidatus Moraniibacteriota bacterium]|nr:MAG: NADP-dependent malic enzyme [Candidatus Moranbacteria bacterium]